MSSFTSPGTGPVMDHGGGGSTHVSPDQHHWFANPHQVPGEPVPPQRGVVREPANPAAPGSGSANPNLAGGVREPLAGEVRSNELPQVSGHNEPTNPADAPTHPRLRPVSKPANPGDTWSPGPAPRFATTNPALAATPAEQTSPLPPVREPAHPEVREFGSANPNPEPATPAGSANPRTTPSGSANPAAPWVRKPTNPAPLAPPADFPAAPELDEQPHPLMRRRSVWALLGFTEDARLIEAGYVGSRIPGRPWVWIYEPREQAARRAERRRWEHELRQLSREFARRVDSFRLAVAPRLSLEPHQVDIRVPIEYAAKGTRTGDVIIRRGDTRMRESTDPADAPTVPPVRLFLPDGFHPETKSLVEGLIKEYFGGEWGSRFHLTAHPHFAEFWRQREKPAPPNSLRWKPSDDPYEIHIGHDGEKDVFISLKTDAPHCGVSAGSGKGKTTTLLNFVQHARSHGDLVDIIDLKEDSFDEATAVRKKNSFNVDVFENVSGIRVHRDVKSAVAALAEFYVSVKSMRIARETGYDMSTVPRRYLVIDEFGSFVGSADFWWKFGLQEKGQTPFRAWFHQILMQGRSKDHRVVVGAHDYDRETFGSTGVRNLIGAKMLIRDNLLNSYIKAFGQGLKRIKINESVKGRAMMQPMPGAPVFELELAHTPVEECLEFLQGCALAPEWFDTGDMAPWISDESIARSHEEMYVGGFLPGGEFVTRSDDGAGAGGDNPPPGLGQHATPGLRVALTESELRERQDAEILTQREALERGYLMPLIREAEARQPGLTPDELLKRALGVMRKAKERGQFPEPVAKGTQGHLYRVGDMREWEATRPNKMEFDADSGDDSAADSRGA